MTAPTVNSFRKTKCLEVENTGEGGAGGTPLAKKIKRERSDSETNRSVLKRRNTEEIKQEDENDTQMEDDPENLQENFDSQHQAEAEENSYEEFSQDQEGHFSGGQTDDVAAGESGVSLVLVWTLSLILYSEVKRLTDQYLRKLEVGGGVVWSCTRCGKQGKMKHHVRLVVLYSDSLTVLTSPHPLLTIREHIESNHIDSLVFNCPFCNKEIKNRVALRSHISKNHREENLRSKGLVL